MQTNQLKWIPALVLFAIVLAFSLSFYYRAPYHDHWDLVSHYKRLQGGDFRTADLFALHGNHWHASGLFVKLVLAKMTGMAHWAESFASVIFAGIGFLALARILSRTLDQMGVTALTPTLWAFGIAAVFFFSLDQAGNWLWGWQVSVFLNLAGALWAIERLSCGALSLRNTALAAVAAAIAIYAFATGWALIPIGWGLLALQGAHRSWRGRGALLIWTLFAGLILFHYVTAISQSAASNPGSGLPAQVDFNTLLGLAHYAVNFVASPVVRFARDISAPITLLGIGILFWSVWTLRRDDRASVWRAAAPMLALAAYSCGAAILTALGRWEAYGVKQAFVSRYISFGSFFWIAVFVLAIIALTKRRERRHRGLIVMLGLLFVLKLGNMPSVVQKTVRLSADIKATAGNVAARYPDLAPADYAVLHAHGQRIEPHFETLHTHRASLFSAPPKDPAEGEGD